MAADSNPGSGSAGEVDLERLLLLVRPLTCQSFFDAREVAVDLIDGELLFTITMAKPRRFGVSTVKWRPPLPGPGPTSAEEIGFPTWEDFLAEEVDGQLSEGIDGGTFSVLRRDEDGTVWVGEDPHFASRVPVSPFRALLRLLRPDRS